MGYEKGKSLYCEECKREKNIVDFYQSNNTEKYPSGFLNRCKKCVTLNVDNWDPSTYLWIIQEVDVPYVQEEWDKLLVKYGQDRKATTGATILGRYFSKMRLKKWKDFRWKDTQYLQEVSLSSIQNTMKAQGYDAQEIAKTLEDKSINIQEDGYAVPEVGALINSDSSSDPTGTIEPYNAETMSAYEAEMVGDLTDEDKRMLCLKWGGGYKPSEWVRLENLYVEMEESYDINGAGHEDVLKLVCKTSLKANQLLDLGDVDGAQKMVKMYDSLMKSGKFQPIQNKTETNDYVDSIGELISMCEKEGYIERFYIEKPNDKIDFVIQDMKQYTKNLIEHETNLSNLIELAVKRNQKEDDEKKDEDFNFDDKEESEITYQDYIDFSMEQQSMIEEDDNIGS